MRHSGTNLVRVDQLGAELVSFWFFFFSICYFAYTGTKNDFQIFV